MFTGTALGEGSVNGEWFGIPNEFFFGVVEGYADGCGAVICVENVKTSTVEIVCVYVLVVGWRGSDVVSKTRMM